MSEHSRDELPIRSLKLRWADFEYDSSVNPEDAAAEDVQSIDQANIMSSEDEWWGHHLVLDIDHEAWLLDSSTPGHHHLIIKKPMTQHQMFNVILALEQAGILEEGYVGASLKRGYTSVRLPWIKKGDPQLPRPEFSEASTNSDDFLDDI